MKKEKEYTFFTYKIYEKIKKLQVNIVISISFINSLSKIKE
jgi:hypothetical protein